MSGSCARKSAPDARSSRSTRRSRYRSGVTDPDGSDPVCGPGCACSLGNEFGERAARHDLEAYRKRGPDDTTAWLIEGLRAGLEETAAGATVLDIGAGVGAVHLELLASGAH